MNRKAFERQVGSEIGDSEFEKLEKIFLNIDSIKTEKDLAHIYLSENSEKLIDILEGVVKERELTEELEDVKEYRKESVVFGNKSNLTDTNGNALEARNATVYQAIEDSKLKFFNSKNEKITSIEPGHAYATGDFLQKNDLQPGDKIMITYGNVKLSVILDGEAKDALLGSSMMGNNRFLLSKQDEGKLAAQADFWP